MPAPVPRESSVSMRLLAKSWFSLTANERWAIMVVLSLFLAGVAARAWHLSHPEEAPRQPVPITGAASR